MNQQKKEASGEAGGVDEARGPDASAVAQQAETGMDDEVGMKPVAVCLADDPTLASRIQAPELERLFQDTEYALWRCSVPAEEICQTFGLSGDELEEELGHQVAAICLIRQVDRIFSENRSDDGALAMYYRRSICTPKNLEMMLTIMDPGTRTDKIRSLTFAILHHLARDMSCGVWNEKLSNGLGFATNFLFQCAKSLERRDDDHDDSFRKRDDIGRLMLFCIDVTKDARTEILNRISQLDWSAILESQRADHFLYVGIAQMLLELPNLGEYEREAKAMLRSFRSCYGLLRRVLKRILRLRLLNETSSPEDIRGASNWMMELEQFMAMFYTFMSAPPSQESERELDILFICVHSTLIDARPYVVNYLQTSTSGRISLLELTVEMYDGILDAMRPERWFIMKGLTTSEREFKEDYRTCKKIRKEVRRYRKAFMRDQTSATRAPGNLCVNCLKTARDLYSDEFQRCSLCKQVAYCSRSCQREHWKRFHRSNCTGHSGKKK